MENEIILSDKKEEVSIVKFEQFNNVNEQLEYAQLLINSGLVAFRKPEQVVLVANLGKALGISFEVASQNIFSINGKPTLSAHLITALAKKAGIDWELIEDCVYIKDSEGKIIDARTSIKFYRFNPHLERIIENTISYTYKQARDAGYLTGPNKSNWIGKLAEMMRKTVTTQGIRFVASDVLMGVFYETGEILEGQGQTYDIDGEGNVVLN